MKKLLVIPLLVAALAACGGSDKAHTFENKTAFESFVAGYLETDARDVHCTKTSLTTANCQTDLGVIEIRCSWADSSGGHDCTWHKV